MCYGALHIVENMNKLFKPPISPQKLHQYLEKIHYIANKTLLDIKYYQKL